MADPGSSPVPTWTVAELHEALNGLLVHVFGDEVWIEGELRNVARPANGHVFFDLVDPGRDGDANPPMLAVVLFATEKRAVNRHLAQQGGAVRMVDGVRVRIRGRLNVGPRSRMQLRMSWIDPAYTVGVMGLERDRVLGLLAGEGLLAANRARSLPVAPLHVAVVTSVGSAAHADTLEVLTRSGRGFRVRVLDARTQGADAERSLVAALRAADHPDNDVVLLVRGGGARTDLVAFDSEAVARQIAASTLPVVTGIGHEIDRTVADEVAHSAHTTPTAAAAAVVALVDAAAGGLHDLTAQLGAAARGRLVRAGAEVERGADRAGRAATGRLGTAQHRVQHLAHRVAVAAPRSVDARAQVVEGLAARLPSAARRDLERADARLDELGARARAHDPVTALARGWSVSRGPDGRVLRSVSELREGDPVRVTLADGTVHTVVASLEPSADAHDDDPSQEQR